MIVEGEHGIALAASANDGKSSPSDLRIGLLRSSRAWRQFSIQEATELGCAVRSFQASRDDNRLASLSLGLIEKSGLPYLLQRGLSRLISFSS